ncbi:MAG TPA: aromatic ring-hydroxylating dioxygenase subunit alpha [Caulobacterales bacterium]|nr:aromatic ring-hydroxylating dioxygenase subunit alpha [Caulobacterales bacterium]
MSAAPETLPASWYRDASLWPRERADIFAKSWMFATHVSAIAEAGSWRAETLAGYPVLIVRDDKGELRAFHNVCRHRAGPLTQHEEGRCDGALVCQYHGWRYALDGRLRQARDFGPADNFDPRELALFPLGLEVWRGLVFVAIDPRQRLSDVLAPLDQRLGDADWSRMHIALRRSHELACNWKTYVENYLEGYHIPLIHAGLDAEVDSGKYNVRVEDRVVIHEAPMRKTGAVYDGLWAWAWPNIGFNIYARGLMMERMAPLGNERTRLDYLYLMPEGESVSEETLAMSDVVVGEDKWVAERVQENLDAGIYDTGRLSPKHEMGVAAFQDMVRRALG